jgi:hypothetical protein
LGETSGNVDSSTQDVTVTMNTGSGCKWTVVSDVNWIAVADAGPGSGGGTFRVTIAANTGSSRTGTVHAASEKFTLRQAAPVVACSYDIKPTNYDAGHGADSVTVTVTAGMGCAWTARSTAPWATIQGDGTGSGNGSVQVQVQANDAAERSTVLTIAGQPFALHQEGSCEYSIKPTWYHAGRGPDDVKIDVKTDQGCTWTASSNVDWVTVTEGATGVGHGRVRLLLQPNDDRDPRRTVLTIAGQPFDLIQNGRDR